MHDIYDTFKIEFPKVDKNLDFLSWGISATNSVRVGRFGKRISTTMWQHGRLKIWKALFCR
jgi:hypothetical protein